jgi:hypothetical protein
MSESEIRQLVEDYRAQVVPLDLLESRLLDVDIPEETDLSRQLVGLLAEASHAHWPEEDIGEELAKAVQSEAPNRPYAVTKPQEMPDPTRKPMGIQMVGAIRGLRLSHG